MDEKPGKVLLDSDDDDDDVIVSSTGQVFEQNCSTGPPKVSPRVADDDDAFDSSDEVERRQVWKQFDRYTDNFFRAGFREAVTSNAEDREDEGGGLLQEAFDSGYSSAFVVGKLFGNVRATLALTKAAYEEGRLGCSDQQLKDLDGLYKELLDAQVTFTKFVDETQVFDELDSKLASGSFVDVDQMNHYWRKKVDEVFDLEGFSERLRALLSDMNCPWSI